MTDVPTRLPRGRHGLSREEVAAAQRDRILLALADTMASKGYVATTVADVLREAGVSRETFYQLFSSKLDAFMAAFDAAGELALHTLAPVAAAGMMPVPTGIGAGVGDGDAEPLDRFAAAIAVYLDNLADQPTFARMFLVEVYAAGPEAIARRAEFQRRVVDAMVRDLGLGEPNRFACELIVAATAALVTPLLVDGDLDAVRALRDPIVSSLQRLMA